MIVPAGPIYRVYGMDLRINLRNLIGCLMRSENHRFTDPNTKAN